MNILLAKKQSIEEKRLNDYTRYQFILAMMNLDYMMIKSFLKNESRYLGWMNSWQFTGWLKRKFEIIGESGFHSRFKEMISLDICPGADMVDFEYVKFKDDDSFGIDFFDQTDDEIFNNGLTLKLSFILVFENGKISNIRQANKGFHLDLLQKYQSEN